MSEQGPTVFNGRYELLRHIARGGMADVYLARDELLDREVALKVLFPEFANDPSFVERFRREAQAAANLNHPNIVGIYDWGQERGTYYIVMEHVSGRSMSDVLRSTGPLQPDRAAEIAADVAAALGTAHQAGLVHRDVKLGNILVSDSGTVKVADFGIATALAGGTDAGLTAHGSVMGTATYFSPEQAQGKPVDGRSDLYSLGVCLYEMLAGTPPFQADTPVAVAYKHVQERPDSLADRGVTIAPSLNAITMKLLAKNPANRYPTADDLRSDLRRYLAGAHKVPGGAAGAAAAGAVAGAAMAGAEPPTPEPTPPADATMVQPVTPTPPAAAGVDPTMVAQAYGAGGYPPDGGYPTQPGGGYYYEEEPDGEDWKRTAALLIGLGVLIFVLGFLTIAFGRQLGIIGDGDDDGDDPEAELVEVPDVTGETLLDAQRLLRAEGFENFEPLGEPNETVPEDEVFEQNPVAGQRVELTTRIQLYYSTGEELKVPSVISMTQADATATLGALGYVVDSQERSDAQDVGLVVDQDPAAGTVLDPGQSVTIFVSTGPETKPVPDVEGDELVDAINTLDDEGFRVSQESVREEASSSVPDGRVIRTEPGAGDLVAAGSEIIVVVSSGIPQVQVPTVVGLFADTAQAAIRAAGLEPVVEFQTVPFGDPQVGVVISQSPAEFTNVQEGSQVVITVGEAAPEPTSTTTTTTTTTTTASTTTTAAP